MNSLPTPSRRSCQQTFPSRSVRRSTSAAFVPTTVWPAACLSQPHRVCVASRALLWVSWCARAEETVGSTRFAKLAARTSCELVSTVRSSPPRLATASQPHQAGDLLMSSQSAMPCCSPMARRERSRQPGPALPLRACTQSSWQTPKRLSRLERLAWSSALARTRPEACAAQLLMNCATIVASLGNVRCADQRSRSARASTETRSQLSSGSNTFMVAASLPESGPRSFS